MCNNCKNISCNGCSYTYQNYPCPQFPPAPGPAGPPGPTGPQGPPGAAAFKIVTGLPVSSNANFPVNSYGVDGSEDVLLVDMSITQVNGIFNILLLPANDPNAAKRVLWISDAFNKIHSNGWNDIMIVPAGADTIQGAAGPASLFLMAGVGGSIGVVTNKTNGYNFI